MAPMHNLRVTGIGSKNCTSDSVMKWVSVIGRTLTMRRCRLYSGEAPGLDRWFRMFWTIHENAKARLILPWPSFEAASRNKFEQNFCVTQTPEERTKALKILHDTKVCCWQDKLKHGVLTLYARNVSQVLDMSLDYPVDVVVYWCTPDKKGNPTGGTRIAVNLARHYDIPNYNLYHDEERYNFVVRYLGEEYLHYFDLSDFAPTEELVA